VLGRSATEGHVVGNNELAGRLGPFRMQGRREPPDSREIPIVEHGRHEERTDVEGRKGNDDEPDSPLRPMGEVGEEAIPDGPAGLGLAHGHGQHDDAIPDFQVSNASGAEETLKHVLDLSGCYPAAVCAGTKVRPHRRQGVQAGSATDSPTPS